MADDIARLRKLLEGVEERARALPWAAERRWRAETHVWREHALPVVDLHDLNAALSREAARAVAREAASLDAGAVCFVTGRGRRSTGKPVLSGVVRDELLASAGEGWTLRPGRAGRVVLVVDEARAPAAATGALSPWFWVGAALFAVASVWACPPAGLLLALSLLALWGWGRRGG